MTGELEQTSFDNPGFDKAKAMAEKIRSRSRAAELSHYPFGRVFSDFTYRHEYGDEYFIYEFEADDYEKMKRNMSGQLRSQIINDIFNDKPRSEFSDNERRLLNRFDMLISDFFGVDKFNDYCEVLNEASNED